MGYNEFMKQCTQCQIEKPLDEFYKQVQKGKNGQSWNCRDSMCISCRSLYASERRRNVKEQAVKYLGGICKDCKKRFPPYVYDFHHLDPNKKDFSIGKQAKKFDSIKAELEKCILLCANCHRIRHYQEKE